MRYRTAFVSNSSSSSFILGLGKIKDLNTFIDFCSRKSIKTSGRIYTTTVLLEDNFSIHDPCFSISENKLNLSEDFTSPGIEIPFDPSKEEYYFVIDIENNEGDASFHSPILDKMDYNITEDYFEGEQAEILKLFKSALFENAKYKFGAYRNG